MRWLNGWKLWALVGLLTALSVGVGRYFSLSQRTFRNDSSNPISVGWPTLKQLDYVTGSMPDKLKEIDGIHVKVPGFMVPLEDSAEKVGEFLLVPYAGACIHVPPPPPNQMIHVKMQRDPATFTWNPIWAKGVIRIETTDSPYGKVYFKLEGTSIENFEGM